MCVCVVGASLEATDCPVLVYENVGSKNEWVERPAHDRVKPGRKREAIRG